MLPRKDDGEEEDDLHRRQHGLHIPRRVEVAEYMPACAYKHDAMPSRVWVFPRVVEFVLWNFNERPRRDMWAT